MVTTWFPTRIQVRRDGTPIEMSWKRLPERPRVGHSRQWIGIAEKELPASRTIPTLDVGPRYSGLGLGLHITSQIVRRTAARLQVSEVNGSSFIVDSTGVQAPSVGVKVRTNIRAIRN